jgi:hypothetical protein
MLAGHPVFWILAAAVLAPLLAEIPLGFKVPVVVLEVVLGIVIGPHVMNLAQFVDVIPAGLLGHDAWSTAKGTCTPCTSESRPLVFGGCATAARQGR